MVSTLKVVQYRSAIRRPEKQLRILRGLGLRKLNEIKTVLDTPETRGMLKKIPHLVKIVD